MVALRSSSNSSILMSSHSSDTTPYPNVELPSRIVNRIPLPTTCKEIFNMFISVSLVKDFQLLCIISSSFPFQITCKPIFHQNSLSLTYSTRTILHLLALGSCWIRRGWRWVRKAFQIPTCWYWQRNLLALGAEPNAKPQCEWFCFAVEYRLSTHTNYTNFKISLEHFALNQTQV